LKQAIVLAALAVVLVCLTAGGLAAQDPREPAAQEAIALFKQADESMAGWFDSAYAFAVFPHISKGGLGVGGAHGKGLVYKGGEVVGKTSLTQFTVGLQLGGQVYQEVIFFEDEASYDNFIGGNFELSAQASAIAAAAGVAANATYRYGVAIFTQGKSGLMYEASVGGQKFSFTPL
jgi:lipid-binding SYLF domain-containing protein